MGAADEKCTLNNVDMEKALEPALLAGKESHAALSSIQAEYHVLSLFLIFPPHCSIFYYTSRSCDTKSTSKVI